MRDRPTSSRNSTLPWSAAAVAIAAAATMVLLALFLVAGTTPASARSAPAQTSLAEIEDEVMCPVCGTLLGLSDAPQAERQRVLIRRLIEEGKSKEEIKEQLVDEFGPSVLALPDGSGFNLAAYLVPIAGFLTACILLLVAVRRWRTNNAATNTSLQVAPDASAQEGRPEAIKPEETRPDAMAPEEERRLDADLARYDL